MVARAGLEVNSDLRNCQELFPEIGNNPIPLLGTNDQSVTTDSCAGDQDVAMGIT